MQYIILFTSYYFADKADRLLGQLGLDHQLIATPPEIHETCGLAIRCQEAIVEDILLELQRHNISRSGIYTYEKGQPAKRINL